MSLADPQTITVSGVTTPLPRTSVDGDESIYTSSDGTLKLSISHSESGKGRKRRVARIDASKIAADIHKPAENVEVSTSIYVVFDVPPAGYSNSELLALFSGWMNQLRASSDAIITKVLAGES